MESKKIELINWIGQLEDAVILDKVQKIKEETSKTNAKREFGSEKGILTYIAEDFDAPLDEFKDYTI